MVFSPYPVMPHLRGKAVVTSMQQQQQQQQPGLVVMPVAVECIQSE
ncbi:oxidoreductin [Aspergillus luchuensis]|uniref:Oxidoreductin n=1 Tax=Aspergillus kawachii TaxID=1069201 RepID=A0A146FXP0_ASPKA|nr:oxidoreductin [Aspergillus luchuensis]